MIRVSSVERFLSSDKTYLQNDNPNIWLVSICEKNISFGNEIYLQANSNIIMFDLSGKNYIVSISNYDGRNIEEIYFRLTKKLDDDFWNDVPKEFIGIIDSNIRYLNRKRRYNHDEKQREVK